LICPAPLVAGIYGLAGNGATMTAADLYSHRKSFFDITKGNNAFLLGLTPGQVCGRDYLCTAKTGYTPRPDSARPTAPAVSDLMTTNLLGEIRMKLPCRVRSAVLTAAIATAVVPGGPAMAGTASAASPGAHGFIKPPCAAARSGLMRSFLIYRPQMAVDQALVAGQAARPHGLTPADLRSAYKLPARSTSNQTVAVSIPFHTPDLASFLGTYRAQFGLPPCTVASGCFRQVNQQGKTTPAEPSAVGTGWDLEATLDVSMISVSCPHCKILVVEAKIPTAANLAATEVTAARLGAQVISNSYGTFESAGLRRFEKNWELRRHTVVAASGDFGFAQSAAPGRHRQRDRGRRHKADQDSRQPKGLDGSGMEREQQRVLDPDHKAGLAT